jgi:hypothetical protein
MVAYGQWPFMVHYVIGSLGPTIAAYIAVPSPTRELGWRRNRYENHAIWHGMMKPMAGTIELHN